MANVVRAALVQAEWTGDKDSMLDKHVGHVRAAASQGVQVLCFQELFYSPYFCQVQENEHFDYAEPVPNGPTTDLMQDLAKETGIVLIVPLFEKEDDGFYYNTAAVIDADGSYLGKYRKTHLPHVSGFWEKFYFRPGNMGYPIFDTAVGRIGVYICYDRHFPEGARALGKNGAQIVFIPSATGGRSKQYWHIEQRGHAIANGYFVATSNRVGKDSTGPNEFYGHSYFCDPYGRILSEAGEEEEVICADLDLSTLKATHVDMPFWRDRRPEIYDDLTAL